MPVFSALSSLSRSLIHSGISSDEPLGEDLFFINRLRAVNLLNLFFFLSQCLFTVVFLMMNAPPLAALSGMASAVSMANIALLRKSGNTGRSAHILAFVFSLAIIVACLKTGGFRSPFIMWLFLLPVGAAFAINFRSSILYGLFAGLIISIFFLAHTRDMVEITTFPAIYDDLFFGVNLYALLVVIVTFVFFFQSTQAKTLNLLAQSEKKFRELSQKAEKANAIKSDFLANMSHEIRTPMNGIIGMMHLLLESPLNPDQEKHARIVFNSARGLLTIINDILDFSKIEAGKMDLDILNFDLLVALEDMNAMFAIQAEQKGIAYSFTLEPGTPTLLRGDPGRVRQVLTNLTGNAIKFTDVGKVTVTVDTISGNETNPILRFTVSDTGIGIPQDKISFLFETFTQADTSTTRMYGGTGLGLSICRLLVRMMKGDIHVSSEEFIGSTFQFTIPFETYRPELQPTLNLNAPLRGKKILLVSDNETVITYLKNQLEDTGLLMEVADDLDQVLDILKQAAIDIKPFQAVLLDIQKHGSCIENLGLTVKNHEIIRDVNLILITSAGEKGEARRFEKAGFSAYLSKPVDAALLEDCLKAVLTCQNNGTQTPGHLVTRHSLAESKKQSLSLLVVEDNETNLLVARELIKRMGYQADSTKNGKEALDACRNKVYDLILMDCQMPVMDGFEATKNIRRMETGPHRTAIIAMTANAMKGVREKCLESGMDDYITKPINPDDLSRVIRLHTDLARKNKSQSPSGSLALEDIPAVLEMEDRVFDRDEMMKRFEGNEELVRIILDSFLEESPDLMLRIREALAINDLETIEACSHSLKGSSANVNAMALTSAALAFEKAAKTNDFENLAPLFQTLEQQFTRFTKEIAP